MGRKRGGSGDGTKLRLSFDWILRHNIESSAKKYATIEQLVGHLCFTYPHYSRHKLQPFTKRVNQSMQISCSRRSVAMDDSDDDGDTPIIKNRRKVDEKEEKLQLLEAPHFGNRRGDGLNSSGSGSSSSSSSASSSEEDDPSSGSCSSSSSSSASSSEEDDLSNEALTSEDAIYGEKFEVEFDLMKPMLRVNLRQKSKKLGEGRKVNEYVESEIVDDLVNGEQKLVNGLSNFYKDVSSGKDDNDFNGAMFKDFGGMSGVIEELKMEVVVPFYHPQLPSYLGVKPLSGILLHGPPGCGKTKLAHAIANETGVPFHKISATELVSGFIGASEENIRELFSKAYRTAPSIVFIDEIDAIASKRGDCEGQTEYRIVTQLMTCMDENANSRISSFRPGYVLVIGATNRPDAIDPALRRPGRFEREIVLGVPDESARVEILSALTRKLKVEGGFDLVKIARSTPGFVGADLAALASKAGNLAMKRMVDKRKLELFKEPEVKGYSEDWWRQPWSQEDMEKLSITMADFEEATKMVQPSSRRQGFSSIPNVKWDDVGGLHFLRQEFDRYIVRRIKFPEVYEDFGVDFEIGFLLYGPPGCGKTLIAKAVANEAGANFIHIKGPELLNKYVGESELAVRTIFSRARTCSPCILFFDEVDALTTQRGEEGGWVVGPLLNQLLIELDGSEQRRGVYVIGATNRPEAMDRALLRPGRFGKLIYVPLPNADERGMILKALARRKPIDASVDLMALGRDNACKNLSGADLSALMNEAAMVALEDKLTSSSKSPDGQKWTIKDAHFRTALGKICPSVSDEQIQYYNYLSEIFKAA
ncbi:Nuclear AAA ATPase (VCP subfamily) [Handroanthus impetiginosus]|uniref:Nuclear AAA ATPase (VCP subfamily) n=1 Tax=Handroanthus impetiginosus TaxID=429701 RepID=A0A2G9I3U8_9LAMI|nr:Nuclear AAA ATPase (VCP subfamily) [Handroanthus impetiginosus]